MLNEGLIFLNCLFWSNPKKIWDIISVITNPQDLFKVTNEQLYSIPTLSNQDREKIKSSGAYKLFKEELRLIRKYSISVIDLFSDNYPNLLKEIPNAPVVLYLKGDENILNQYLFAIVGSRIPTIYGINQAEEFAFKLAALGLVIVSGLALGIDSYAHKAALRSGKTLAVLGSGLLNIYPQENRNLLEAIINKGAVISEFPLRITPLKSNFPQRNRIISGIAKGVLVVEASPRSGSLITAHCACEQNREVFALPGNIDSPLSKGTNALIKEGAKLVDSIESILEELGLQFQEENSSTIINLSEPEAKILKLITRNGIYVEEILTIGVANPESILKILLDLQLKGFIEEFNPNYYRRKI